MAELVGPLPFALVAPGGTNRVEPEPPTAAGSNAPRKFCGSEVSLRVARAYWLAVVTMHSLVALYFYSYAAVYKRVASSSSSQVMTLSSTLTQTTRLLAFVTPVEVASSAIAICHTIAVVNALLSSFRSRELVFSPDIWLDGPDKKAALAAVQKRNRETWRVLKMLFAAYDKLKKRGLYLVQVFAVVQVALQVFQAAKLSHLVARAWLNRLMVAAIVANCWYIPLMHYVFQGRHEKGRHMTNPALEVLVHHGVDSLLDVVYGIVVPLALFLPYRQTMDIVVNGGLTSSILYYHDTWLINAVAEHTQIFVSSWTDFVAKIVPGIALLYQLRGLQTLLQVSRTTTLKRQITFKLPNVRPTTTPAVGTSGAVVPSSASTNTTEEEGKRPPRGKIRLFFDVLLLATGVAVLSVHVHAESVASSGRDPECLLEMRPWGVTTYACTVLEVSCLQRGLTGDTLDVSLVKIEPQALRGLIFSHCPALSIPASIQSFSALQMLKIHNVTLVEWTQDTALTELKHPQLTRIFISLTNMSAIPPGLLSSDFPSSVDDIQFCGTNLTTLPEDVHLKWTHVDTFVLELSPGIVTFPVPLTKMPLQLLSLASNAIRSIPDDLLATQSSSFHELVLMHNPLQTLPQSIGNLTSLTTLNIIGANVSELSPTWLTKDLAIRSESGDLIEIRATGTPLCSKLSHDASSTTDLVAINTGGWFLVNCVTTESRATVFPLDEEITWRAAKR